MKSNDTLLCHLVATDQMHKAAETAVKRDERYTSPKHIEVNTDEIVYIHCVRVFDPKDFQLTITSATQVLTLNHKNTFDGTSNTIVKCLSNVHFKSTTEFVVQLLRVQFSNPS